MSIRLKVILLLSLSMLLAVLISALALFGSDRVMEQSLQFNKAAGVTQTLSRALARATTTIKADPIVPGTASLLAQVNTDLETRFKAARTALAGNQQPELMRAINNTASAWADYYQQSLDLSKMAETDPASALGMIESVYQTRFVPLQASFHTAIDAASAWGDSLAGGIAANLRTQRLRILLALAATATVLIVLVSLFLLQMKRSVSVFQRHSGQLVRGDLTSRFNDRGKDEISTIGGAVNHFLELFGTTLKSVRAAADQNDSVVNHLQQVTGETDRHIATQANETRQMQEALEQLSLSFREVAEKSALASDTAADGERIVGQGSAMGDTTRNALESIDTTVTASGNLVDELSKAIDEVASVTRAIHDISEQTSLLALNAAIEAARAGNHGRGFAVVADEVKQLADRTRSLTSDITSIVNTVQSSTQSVHSSLDEARNAVATGVASGHAMGELVAQMNHSIQSVAAMLRDVATSTEEQSAVTVDISRRIERVSAGGEHMQAQMSSVLIVIANLEQANSELHHRLNAFLLDEQAEPALAADSTPIRRQPQSLSMA